MIKSFACFCAVLFATSASGQSRESWIRKCQAADAELSNSTGYRVCTELYVQRVEKRQKELLREISSRISGVTDDYEDGNSAVMHLKKSQAAWRTYVQEHCLAAQAMFGSGHTSGDAIPFCMASEVELRNRQLSRILKGEYER